MRFEEFSFGSIQIDGSVYEHDVVIDRLRRNGSTRLAHGLFRRATDG